MSATETKQAGTRTRAQLAKALRDAAASIRTSLVQAGNLLAEARLTFGEKDGDKFLVWAQTATGWNRAMIYRVQQAAAVVSETPQASTLKSVDSIALLSRVPADKRAKVLKDAGTNPTHETMKSVVAKAVPPKKSRGKAGDAEKSAKRLQALIRKHRSAILTAYEGTPEDRLSLMLIGAVLAGKIGADAPKVIRHVIEDATNGDDS